MPATSAAPLVVLRVLMLIEFLSIGLMVSEFLCAGVGRVCVRSYMIHVRVLKYCEARPFSSLRSWVTSIFVGLDDVVRMLTGSFEG